MAEPRIVMPTHGNLEPDVLAIARDLLPAGFQLDIVQRDQLAAALPGADFLLGFIGRLSDELLLSAKRLKLAQLLSAGYDSFNLAGARAARIPVAVNGGANAIAVAEHAIMLMLATLKRLTDLNAAVQAGRWRGDNPRVYELWSSTVGIVGFGHIGQHVAERLQPWGANVLYHDPVRPSPDRERQLGVRWAALDDLLATADVVSIHAPLNDHTRHLINARALSRLKPTAVLVNTARGELVDEAALVAALKARQFAGAGLDVLSQEPSPPNHPLYGLPNVILTPHLAGPTWQSWPRRFTNGYANISRVAQGQPPRWVVPELADLVAGS